MDERTEKSLNMLKSFVLNDAHSRREELAEKYVTELGKMLAEKKRGFTDEAEGEIKKSIEKIRHENRAEILAHEQNVKKELIAYREQLVDEVFEEVKEKIISFKVTDEYEKWLCERAKQAISICGEGEKVIFSGKEDTGKLSALGKTEAEDNILCGVRVENKDTGIIADYSVDNSMTAQREEFLKSCGLTIEI